MVSGRFRSRSLVERGRSLHEGQPVVVDVVSRQSGRGRSFSLVKDFRPAGQPTVVSYVDGSCPNDPTNQRLVRQEFGPACLFTKRDVPEIQRARSEYADEVRELPAIPVLEDATLAGIDFDILDLPPLNVATFRERISGGANQGRARDATRKEVLSGADHREAPRG
jgi:hypothetical protein